MRAAQPQAIARQGLGAAVVLAVAEDDFEAGPQRTPVPQTIVEEAAPKEHDSEERLVAAQSEPSEEPTAVIAAPSADESIPPIDVTEVELLEEEEEEEEAPISSRRTVASEPEERLADMAFGGEEPRQPLHTPPPESGRLPAAPASDFDPDITGVRSAAPAAPNQAEAEQEPRPREFVAEAVRPELAQSDMVVEVVFAAQGFAPATFVALLDASLGL